MLLRTIVDEPLSAIRHMERRVNRGSPSGFTRRYTTSPETSPFGRTKTFSLFLATAPGEYFESFGGIPSWPCEGASRDESWLLVHPDMASSPELRTAGVTVRRQEQYHVSPTASGRTVQYVDGPDADYAKLHYAGILGRVDRRLSFNAAISGPEVSILLSAALAERKLDARLAFLPEPGGRVLRLPTRAGLCEWGMTWRSSRPCGQHAKEIVAMIPVFSLFSPDKNAKDDLPLICQLIDSSGRSPSDYVLHDVIIPMVNSYFALIRDLGLQPEWNAQNLLIGVDKNARIVSFVMRDLESVDKDLTLRAGLGLEYGFRSCPHKCIYDQQYNYQIKHSFMFDYKFGEYIIIPVLRLVSRRYGLSYTELVEAVRATADDCLRLLPANFFPDDGCWYRFAKELVDQSKPSRPYVKRRNPPFRSRATGKRTTSV